MGKLHLQVVEPTKSLKSGILTLSKSGQFTVTIKEYWDELKNLENNFKKNIAIAQQKKEARRKEGWSEKRLEENWNANKKIEDENYIKNHNAITDKYHSVNWVWSLVPLYKSQTPIYDNNSSVALGLDDKGNKTLTFPDLIVGGGFAYIEAFFPDEQPVGNTSNGIFVNAKDTAAFIRAEWTDFRYNPLNNQELKYGSEVFLHIYTSSLYGEDIEIRLFDKEKIFDDKLNISDQWSFKRKVKAKKTHPFEAGKPGVGKSLFDEEKAKNKEENTHIQKVQIRVKIDDYWAIIAKSRRKGTDLDIYAKVYYKGDELKAQAESQELKIRDNGTLYDEPAEVTNQPVLVEDFENNSQNELKYPIDFTFGVFLDGTLNNMYNTEIRQKVEEARNPKNSVLHDPTPVLAGVNATDVYRSKSSKAVFEDPTKGDSSFENDLSNPAILFKNYEENLVDVFKVYTEGIGTNSAPSIKSSQNDKSKIDPEIKMGKDDYKKDDLMEGPAFGMGTAGIKDKVKKAIRDVVTILKQNIDSDTDTTGTITFDIFGFSRGAAAARHFVHVVKHSGYKPQQSLLRGDNEFVLDLQGNDVDVDKYYNKLMPPFGVLGQMLTDENLMDARTRVIVRFVGIYDTVPHHGLFQWNDIKDLGLDNVNKAEYVVHMVADDEHRANFSLVDISSVAKTDPDSGKKGGIELKYPGVHCDVGGAYVEGWPDNPLRIDADISAEALAPLQQVLIAQGWFKDKIELYAVEDNWGGANYLGNNFRLEGKRILSNQYSFIPLHIMAEFCEKRGVPIKQEKEGVIKNYIFYENTDVNKIIGNVQFLTDIKKILRRYSFENGNPLQFINSEEHNNKPIMFLRNHYLHWNSQYGEKGMDLLSQKNYPNREGGIFGKGKRKRMIR